jgi:hypothetical protein
MNHGNDRHCLSTEQMIGKGWTVNASGFWIERTRQNASERSDATRRSGNLGFPLPHQGGAL